MSESSKIDSFNIINIIFKNRLIQIKTKYLSTRFMIIVRITIISYKLISCNKLCKQPDLLQPELLQPDLLKQMNKIWSINIINMVEKINMRFWD